MRILLAPDSFKDSLPAAAVCAALKRGVQRTFPSAVCRALPLADGGEGTLDVLAAALGGEFVHCPVHDPLFRPIEADYLWLPDTATAVVEMARASGLELLTPAERNCLHTNTLGTGELILHALQRGARHLVLTVGGSATNDAGIGMATALGFRFLDDQRQPLLPTGENLGRLASIDTSQVTPLLAQAQCRVVTDVTNPFYGPEGAAHVFAAQKGADAAAIAYLDAGLRQLATVLQTTFGLHMQTLPGSGAGGGVGGGAHCFLRAPIESAADWVLTTLRVADYLRGADVLITGEGKIDGQTWQGKLLSRLLALAEGRRLPVVLVAGTLHDVEAILAKQEVLYATSILPEPMPLAEALRRAPELLEQQGQLLGRLLAGVFFQAERGI